MPHDFCQIFNWFHGSVNNIGQTENACWKDKKDNNIENKQEEEKIEEDKSKKNNSETEEATDLNVDVKTEKTEEKIKSED